MKKLHIKASALLIIGSLILSGCSNGNTNSENTTTDNSANQSSENTATVSSANEETASNLRPISEIHSNISEETQSVLKKEFDNITFSENFFVNFPDFSEIYTFNSKTQFMSTSDAYDYFDKCFDAFFGDIYNEEDKKELYRVMGIGGQDISKTYPFDNPACHDYMDEIRNNEFVPQFLLYGDKNGYLQVRPSGATMVFRNNLAELDNHDRNTPAMYFVAPSQKTVESIKIGSDNIDMNKKYQLMDGEISLADAVAFAENFLNNDLKVNGSQYVTVVSDIYVMDMGEGKYSLSMSITQAYKGVPFDAADMEGKGGGFSSSPSSDGKDYDTMPGQILLMYTDMLEYAAGTNYLRILDNIQTYTEIISFEDAIDIMSESVSGALNFEASCAEFVYTSYSDTDADGNTLKYNCPSWKLTAYNPLDTKTYCMYVNAINGDFHYYTFNKGVS